jgi:hypothetical protein
MRHRSGSHRKGCLLHRDLAVALVIVAICDRSWAFWLGGGLTTQHPVAILELQTGAVWVVGA